MKLRRTAAAGGSNEYLWGTNMKQCPNCGTKSLPENFEFCGKCGTKL